MSCPARSRSSPSCPRTYYYYSTSCPRTRSRSPQRRPPARESSLASSPAPSRSLPGSSPLAPLSVDWLESLVEFFARAPLGLRVGAELVETEQRRADDRRRARHLDGRRWRELMQAGRDRADQ